MTLKDRLTGIDTNLDDLEAGVDAEAREVDHIRKAASSMERLQATTFQSADLLGTLVRHAKELQACVRDQRAALHELRNTVARLHDELTESSTAVSAPLTSAAERHRR